MKVGVIGTGTMGKNHVRIYSEFKAVEEIYVFDSNKDTADRMKEYDAIVCDSIEELLDNVDAVSICIPTKYHFDVARKVIEMDIHCLIEKPITLSVKEGRKLLDLLRDKNLVLGVGHIER
ncbi:MAG: gfo/Idh/MocA family oxidoreductase, partial [Candidatus Syntrophoarchaeum sp. WYZ-LMO15]